MKKYFYTLLTTLMAVMMTLVSCSGEDDIDDSSKNLSCPDNHHPHMIDLGLPSGTLWACSNVGADKPEAYGGYYAWGEIEEIASTQYDVAHVKWGGSGLIPSVPQFKELTENCSHTRTTINGVNGGLYIGPSGGKIFLPAAGYRLSGAIAEAGKCGEYWLSSSASTASFRFWDTPTDIPYMDPDYNSVGRTVRLVIRK